MAGFDKLTRQHGIKVSPVVPCSVEECSLAVGEVVGHGSIRSASRMNHGIVIFLDNVEKVNAVVENGIVIKDTLTTVLPLVNPARRITLSNVPPFLRDPLIERELSRHGQIVSPIKKVPLGCKSPLLKHVMSFRRQVHMILKNDTEELNIAFKYKIDNFDYVIFATSETMKCFGCGKTGHLVRACPDRDVDGRAPQTGAPVPAEAAEQTDHFDTAKHGAEESDETAGVAEGSSGAEASAEAGEGSCGAKVSAGAGGAGEDSGSTKTSAEAGEGSRAKVSAEAGEGSSGAKALEVSEQQEEVAGSRMATEVAEAVLVEVDEEEDFVMEDDLPIFKIPAPGIKRKTTGKYKSRAKKGAKRGEGKVEKEEREKGNVSNIDESNKESSVSSEEDSSQTERKQNRVLRGYSFEKIRKFLQNTKGKQGVVVEEYFPDKEKFMDSVRILMKGEGEQSFTDQEVYRLKKIIQRMKNMSRNTEEDNDMA